MPYLVVLARFVVPIALPLGVKVTLAAVLFVGSQYHLWCRLSSGSVFSPEFPRWLVILLTWSVGTILFLALLVLGLDVVTVLTMVMKQAYVTVPDSVQYVLAATAALLAGIGVVAAIRVPPLKDISVPIRDLPLQFDGYRLLQLSDLHISRLFPAAWARTVVDRANALGVDLMVVTGDFIDGTLAARRADVEPLRHLRAPDGVYAVSGNHESIFGAREWTRHLATLGLHFLANDHVFLERGAGRLALAGVTDLSGVELDGGRDLEAALAGIPADLPVVLLDHQPRMARDAAAHGVALQLSGHTHGGMIRGLDRLVARGNAGYVSGRYDVDGMTLYVNNGTALWPGFALRLGRPPELTRITLRQMT